MRRLHATLVEPNRGMMITETFRESEGRNIFTVEANDFEVNSLHVHNVEGSLLARPHSTGVDVEIDYE